MEKFSVWLAICAGNTPVTGEFPTKSVTRSFDVLFDLRLNKRWSKQLWGWWFEAPIITPLQWHTPMLRQGNCCSCILDLPNIHSAFAIFMLYETPGITARGPLFIHTIGRLLDGAIISNQDPGSCLPRRSLSTTCAVEKCQKLQIYCYVSTIPFIKYKMKYHGENTLYVQHMAVQDHISMA